MKKIISLTSLLLISCSLPSYYNSPEDFKNSISCNYDRFTKTETCYSPILWNTTLKFNSNGKKEIEKVHDELYGTWSPSLKFRLTKTNNKEIYQLYFSANNYKKWIFFNSAYDEDGTKLKFIEIDRSVSGEFTHEDFAINISKEYLQNYQTKGLNIKLVGKYGESIFFIQPAFIQGFLRYIDK